MPYARSRAARRTPVGSNAAQTSRAGVDVAAMKRRLRPWVRAAAAGFAVVLLSACMPRLPPRWVDGGARLVIPEATWELPGGGEIQLTSAGPVLRDGEEIFFVDRAGRIADEDREAVAILLAEGTLVGLDETRLGHVGVRHAALPGSLTAWLGIDRQGRLTLYDRDGVRHAGGRWHGCEGPAIRTCTLVAHVYALSLLPPAPSPAFIGFGL